MSVELKSLTKVFSGFQAVNNLNLSIETGKFVAILGPSGCGKTTTLRLLAGFELPSSGSIHINGRDVKDLPPRKRNLGVVFQNYALFPHMTVFDNVAYGLKMQRCRKVEIERRVNEALALVHLSDLGARKPRELSGGQQQRVALARSIVLEPDLLLFDEPLSNLDAKLRDVMRTEIRRIHQSLGITTVFVTHDQDEALSMADLVVVMNKGSVEQIGTPDEVYWKPATRFVAEFIGASNWLPATIESLDGDALLAVSCGAKRMAASRATSKRPELGTDSFLLVRPEDIFLSVAESGTEVPASNLNRMRGSIKEIVFLGAGSECRVALDNHAESSISVRVHARTANSFHVGQQVELSWSAQACRLFQDEVML